MSRHPFIPQELRGRPFTTAEADAAGLTASMRRGRHVEQVHRGVWSLADTPRTFEFQVHAARMALARDAVLSHVSALRWLGVEVGRETPIHFSTNRPRQTREDIVLHRRIGTISPRLIRGIDTLGPDRSFVDSATILGIRQLVRAGDALVRARVDSFRETDLRLLIVLAGLPEPEVNVDVHADDGTWLARGDLVLPELRVVIEHDGWVHERDAEQRQKDHFRRERIEAAGWTLIVVTVADFQHPISVVTRIFEALRRRGYDGPPPELTRTWRLCARNL